MTTAKTAKKDGRRNNGREPTELSEAAILIRCSAELYASMAERAVKDGRPIAETWRRAAEEYLAKRKT